VAHRLETPETLAQQTPRAVADDRLSDLPAHGQTEPVHRLSVWQCDQDEEAALETPAPTKHPLELCAPPQAPVPREDLPARHDPPAAVTPTAACDPSGGGASTRADRPSSACGPESRACASDAGCSAETFSSSCCLPVVALPTRGAQSGQTRKSSGRVAPLSKRTTFVSLSPATCLC